MKLIITLAILGLVASIAFIPLSFLFLEYLNFENLLMFTLPDVLCVVALFFLLISKNPTGSKKAFAVVMIIVLFFRLVSLTSFSYSSASAEAVIPVERPIDNAVINSSYSSDASNSASSNGYDSFGDNYINYDENGNIYFVGEYTPTYSEISRPSTTDIIMQNISGYTLWYNKIVNLASIIVLVILFILGMKRKGTVKIARKLSVGAFIGYFVIFAVSSIYLLVVYPITHTKMLCTMILGNGIGLIFFCLLALYFIRLSVRTEPTGEEKRILEERLARIEKEFSDGEITREIYELKREIALSDYDT
jgi:hypothetical protein